MKNETKSKANNEPKSKAKNAAKSKAISEEKNKAVSKSIGQSMQWGLISKIIIGVVAVVILLAVIVMAVKYWQKSVEEEAQISAGIHYLEELEKQDMQEISGNIKSVRDANLMNLAEMDESAVWAVWDELDILILGDSRAVGFYHYEFVPQARALAQGGGKITDIEEELDQIKAINPEHIFLCFGLNDVGIGFWPTGEEYAAVCDEEIQILQEELPNATIYLNSILPATGVGLEADPDYPRIGEYNEAMEAMCKEKGYHFVNNTQVAEEHTDLYAADGLHLNDTFYKYWAANMLTEVD